LRILSQMAVDSFDDQLSGESGRAFLPGEIDLSHPAGGETLQKAVLPNEAEVVQEGPRNPETVARGKRRAENAASVATAAAPTGRP
jgi:hypothetical protein